MSIVLQMSHVGAHTSNSPILVFLVKTTFETHLLELSFKCVHESHKETGHIITSPRLLQSVFSSFSSSSFLSLYIKQARSPFCSPVSAVNDITNPLNTQ